jgi:hypothetical protein
MSKVHGPKTCYVPIRENATQVIISYDYQADGKKNAYWQEVYFNKNRTAKPSLEQIKQAVIADIDRQTDEKILKECPWTVLHGDDQGKEVTLWLTAENQRNYSEGQRVAQITAGASLPMKFKVGENEDGTAVYDIFETVEEITQFYIAGVNFINQTLNEGWQRKDSMDWSPYTPDEPEPQSQS